MNIVFLMSDEHRPDVAGFAGNDIIRTPNLDRLAQDAVVFDNAYTPSPICVPARQALMNGRLPRTSGIEHYGWDLAPGAMTWSRRFAQFGYDTVCCGKLHHRGIDQMQGWTRRPFGDLEFNFWDIPDRQNPLFDQRQATVQGKKWSDAKEILRAGITDEQHVRFDRRATQAACDVIDDHFCSSYYDRNRNEKLLLLKLSLTQPHYPYCATEERFNYYLNRVSVYDDEQLFDHPFLSERHVAIDGEVTARDLRRATAAYYAMIEQVDEHIGTVLNRLEHFGENIDDWLIIYTSDHGEMLGQHGVWEKRAFFDASARVPLFIRYPKQFSHRRVTENVNLCDLFATMCEIGDVSLPNCDDGPSDSRSLVSLMHGNSQEWHEKHHDETISQFDRVNCMVKRGDLKYHCYGVDRPDVLFDLDKEPEEKRNLISEPAYAEAVAGLRQRAQELGLASLIPSSLVP